MESNSDEEEYNKCDHECSVKKHGTITCLSCGLETRYLSHTPEKGYDSRTIAKSAGPDNFVEIREKMTELIKHSEEFLDDLEELCQICNEYKLPDGHPRKKTKQGPPI